MFPVLMLFLFFCPRKIASYEVEAVTQPRILGEAPHWDVRSQNLYFVDDFGSSIHRYTPSKNRETYCKIDDSAAVSIVIPLKNSQNEFVVTIGRNLTVVTWDGESTSPQKIRVVATVDEEPGQERNQFNDGKVDPTGRLWVGTMGAIGPGGAWTPEKGSLYSFPKGGDSKKHVDKLSIANGLAWNKNRTKMFYIDSPTRRIDVFDFDAELGEISNRRLFFDVDPHVKSKEGGPDGMTIDVDDDLWFAVFGQGVVFNVNGTTGNLIRKIVIPSINPTSVAFGGPHLDELYVTTATFGLSDDDKKQWPESGSTFRVKGLGVKGIPALPAELSKIRMRFRKTGPNLKGGVTGPPGDGERGKLVRLPRPAHSAKLPRPIASFLLGICLTIAIRRSNGFFIRNLPRK